MGRSALDVTLPNAGGLIWIAPRELGGLSPDDLAAAWTRRGSIPFTELVRRGLLLPASLEKDDGYNVRIVVGDLDEAEASGWTARARANLRVHCGRLMISGILTPQFAVEEYPVFEKASPGSLHELGCWVDVPPGDYTATVLSYPPGKLPGSWQALQPHTFVIQLLPARVLPEPVFDESRCVAWEPRGQGVVDSRR